MPETKAASKKVGKFSPVVITIFLIGTVLLQHAFLFVFIAMLPTIVAYIVDTRPRQPIFVTVAALNFAGLIPYLFEIAFSPSSVPQASAEVMSDVFSWFFIYASAGLGWALILSCPTMCAVTLKGMRRGQIMHLENQQRKLVEEWGPEVMRRG